jgi:aminocarboxymuconate-semialdehyde decarboxylase
VLNRRAFLKDLTGVAVGLGAGVAASGSALAAGASRFPQSAGAAGRRQVLVGGHRVRTIDIHAHCSFPEAMALMDRKPAPNDPLIFGAERLRQMDEHGIDITALSINPYWYSAEREVARDVIALQNEKMAELCAAHPDRLVGLASVALQFPDLAAEQLEDGVKKRGLRGAHLGGHVNGEELASPRFDPFWAKAEELGVPVTIHPSNIPELAKRLEGSGYLTNIIALPLDTTIMLSHLIFEGTLDRFPALKICASHGGGFLGSYIARSDRTCLAFPENCKQPPKKHPSEYLKQLYFDSIVFTPEALRHLVAESGASQILLGTDYPFPWTVDAVDHILATHTLSNPEQEAILGGNAAKLLRIGSPAH